MNIYFAVIILAFSLATSSTALADREQAAMNAQKMADAQQRQADAADNAAWDAEMRAVKNPTTSNMMESWDREDAADAAQDSADAAQTMADDLSDE
ncbi:hypothetical protein I7V30_10265 [Lelliottia amnigena]|uniref:hypothetical protein n=1 Tax=Lelliottia amnigena TaxID=61646 RepID=UPI00192B769F|nr:hypothetical protein [Lelliottia amnigena]MBL5965646.1 hypothetical protein [Lelliottia amnigena]